MGMYTELILGCRLDNPPQHVLDTLNYLLGLLDVVPDNYPFNPNLPRYHGMLRSASSYFPSVPHFNEVYRDPVYDSEVYIVNVRCSLKNYNNEIETFLKWLKPHIGSGSGKHDMYAIVMYEEATEPKIYYLHEE